MWMPTQKECQLYMDRKHGGHVVSVNTNVGKLGRHRLVRVGMILPDGRRVAYTTPLNLIRDLVGLPYNHLNIGQI